MAACDGSLTHRGLTFRCELPAGHDGPCKTGALTFRRVVPAWVAGDLADAPPVRPRETVRSRGRKRLPREPRRDAPALAPGECSCDACCRPCAACTCPRTYKSHPANRRYDAEHPGRNKEAIQRLNAERRAAGVCITCGKAPASGEKGGGRCAECVRKGAANAWRARLVRQVIGHPDWDCQHSGDGGACADCRRCISRFVRENEVDLRAAARDARPAAIAAAVAKRDRWHDHHEAAASDEGGERP